MCRVINKVACDVADYASVVINRPAIACRVINKVACDVADCTVVINRPAVGMCRVINKVACDVADCTAVVINSPAGIGCGVVDKITCDVADCTAGVINRPAVGVVVYSGKSVVNVCSVQVTSNSVIVQCAIFPVNNIVVAFCSFYQSRNSILLFPFVIYRCPVFSINLPEILFKSKLVIMRRKLIYLLIHLISYNCSCSLCINLFNRICTILSQSRNVCIFYCRYRRCI